MPPKKSERHRSELIQACIDLHYELFASGLYRTAQKMHEVVREIGYEVADGRDMKHALTLAHKKAREHE